MMLRSIALSELKLMILGSNGTTNPPHLGSPNAPRQEIRHHIPFRKRRRLHTLLRPPRRTNRQQRHQSPTKRPVLSHRSNMDRALGNGRVLYR